MLTILDTGPLVALMNSRDRWHSWAVEAFATVTAPLFTCEAVLTEAAHLTGMPEAIISKMSTVFSVRISLEKERLGLERLLKKYAGRMDLADACVVRLSEMHRRSQVFTLDVKDFKIYRRNGRDVIPLLAPSK